MTFDVIHRSGIKNHTSDAFPRLEMTGDDNTPLQEYLTLFLVGKEEPTLYAVDVHDGRSEQLPEDGPNETMSDAIVGSFKSPTEGHVPTATDRLQVKASDIFCMHCANIICTPRTVVDVNQEFFMVGQSQVYGVLHVLIAGPIH